MEVVCEKMYLNIFRFPRNVKIVRYLSGLHNFAIDTAIGNYYLYKEKERERERRKKRLLKYYKFP